MPRISVIVPVYNVEKYIHRCIDSILAQTFADFELILVDDCSPDNCGKICDEYAKENNRIHVIHKENGGLSDARNVGIDWAFDNSDSEWITFIDSDDWIHPKYLEALYNAVKETGCSLSVCGFKRTKGEEPLIDESSFAPVIWECENFYCKKNINAIIACSKLLRKHDFCGIRFPVGKLHEDEFTTYKVLFKYEKIAFVNQPLYFYFQNQSGIMRSAWKPERLVSIEALEERIRYIEKKKLNAFIEYSVKFLIEEILRHYNYVNQSENIEHKKYLTYIIRHFRKGLRIARKYDILSFDDNTYYYEIAYPTEMKYYWYWQILKNKLKRK